MGEVSTIGLDIAKSVFQVHGVDVAGAVVIRKRVSRTTSCIAAVEVIALVIEAIQNTETSVMAEPLARLRLPKAPSRRPAANRHRQRAHPFFSPAADQEGVMPYFVNETEADNAAADFNSSRRVCRNRIMGFLFPLKL